MQSKCRQINIMLYTYYHCINLEGYPGDGKWKVSISVILNETTVHLKIVLIGMFNKNGYFCFLKKCNSNQIV